MQTNDLKESIRISTSTTPSISEQFQVALSSSEQPRATPNHSEHLRVAPSSSEQFRGPQSPPHMAVSIFNHRHI